MTTAYIVTFRNSTDAMEMKTVAEQCGLPGTLIPTPRQLTTSCGLSWGAAAEHRARIDSFLKRQGVRYERATAMPYRGVL